MIRDNFKIKGKVNVKCFDANNNLKWEHSNNNTLTNLHDVLVADRVSGGIDAIIDYVHAGTGGGQTASDVNLDAYYDVARTQLTSVTQQGGANDNDVIYLGTIPAGTCTGSIEEIGLFITSNQATGDMQAYDDSISKTKAAADTLVITWTITYGAS